MLPLKKGTREISTGQAAYEAIKKKEVYNGYCTILYHLGFQHVTDLNGLDHLYFIAALSLPFGLKDWKKLLWWVTLFTLDTVYR